MPGQGLTPEYRSFDETRRPEPMKPFSTEPKPFEKNQSPRRLVGGPASQSITFDQSLLRGKRYSNQIQQSLTGKIEPLTSVERVSDIYKVPKVPSQRRSTFDGQTPLGMNRTLNKTSRASLSQEKKQIVRPPSSSEVTALRQ